MVHYYFLSSKYEDFVPGLIIATYVTYVLEISPFETVIYIQAHNDGALT